MNKVGRAIKRIDDPFVISNRAFRLRTALTRLFSQKGMVRIGVTENFDNGSFSGSIDFRDIISGTFACDLKSVEIKAGAVNNRAGAPGRLDGGIKHRIHVRLSFCQAKTGF